MFYGHSISSPSLTLPTNTTLVFVAAFSCRNQRRLLASPSDVQVERPCWLYRAWALSLGAGLELCMRLRFLFNITVPVTNSCLTLHIWVSFGWSTWCIWNGRAEGNERGGGGEGANPTALASSGNSVFWSILNAARILTLTLTLSPTITISHRNLINNWNISALQICRHSAVHNCACARIAPAPGTHWSVIGCRAPSVVIIINANGSCRWQLPKTGGLNSRSQVAWSEGRRPLGAALHSPDEPSELSQWHGRDDITINIVVRASD